jgi:hypothetical protein
MIRKLIYDKADLLFLKGEKAHNKRVLNCEIISNEYWVKLPYNITKDF